MSSPRHRPAGSLADGDDPAVLTPADAGWRFCGLRVLRIGAGASRSLATGENEMAVLPLRGGVQVDVGGRQFELAGRSSVFTAVTDWLYVPRDETVTLSSSSGAEVALPSALARRRFEPAYTPAADVPVEVRGAGTATRQLNNFMAPGTFDGADRLMCVEVLTPDGNWSSYPPHRHDDSPDCVVNNEEIYYFRIGSTAHTSYEPAGFALHRLYTTDGVIDDTVVVRDGDVFLVPRGYHGPSIAAPGYPLYYLNVLAGEGARSMAFCDDPNHAWVRRMWAGMAPDPRCPITSAAGPGRR